MKDDKKKRDLHIYLPALPKKLRRKVIKWLKDKRREELFFQRLEKDGRFSPPVD